MSDEVCQSLEQAIEQNLQLKMTVKSTLKRLLSTKSTISTTSSVANFQQQATGSQSPFREIGTGIVGKILGWNGMRIQSADDREDD